MTMNPPVPMTLNLMTRLRNALAVVAVACFSLSAAAHAQQLIGYVHNTVNPEDMALVPGTKWLVASTDQTPGKSKPGYLYVIDTRTGVARLVSAKVASTPTAGDPSCQPVPLNTLAMSGLGMRTAENGTHQLMAVNRGARMSIEFFDIDLSGPVPTFTWSGCVHLPPKAFPNAVVPTNSGGLAVTVSFETDNTHFVEQLEKKAATGYLLTWTKQGGFQRVPGSELSLDNGLKVDPAGKFYYIAGWGSETILKLPTAPANGPAQTLHIGMKPDNLSWSRAGTLIVAGQIQSATDIFSCVASSADVCPTPFKIIEVDPATMSTLRVLVDDEALQTYAAATTGLEVGDEIWVSSFRNNKIARYRRK